MAISVLRTIPNCEEYLLKLCARYQGSMAEINELHQKVIGRSY